MEHEGIPHPDELHTRTDIKEQMEAATTPGDTERQDKIAETFDPDNQELLPIAENEEDFDTLFPLANEAYRRIEETNQPHVVQHEAANNDWAELASPMLTAENFEAQAQDIIATLAEAAKETRDPRVGARRATEAYVTEEENPRLKKFSEMLLGATNAERTERNLAALAAKISNGTATGEDQDQYRDLRDTVIRYNHQIRDVIWENPDMFTHAQLNEWVEMCGNGDSDWANSVLQGASAEVAVAREIWKVSGVREVRFGTIQEDSRGKDIVVILEGGREVDVDVKSGKQSLGFVQRGNGMEIGVENEMLRDFKVGAEYESRIQSDFARGAGLDRGLTRTAR